MIAKRLLGVFFIFTFFAQMAQCLYGHLKRRYFYLIF